MYIEKKNILFAWTVFCVCSLFSLKTVRAESIIGTYQSDSLGDVLYISEDKGEKTESEKQADAEVLEKDPFALESGRGSTSLIPLGTFKITGYCPCRKCSEGFGKRTASGRVAVSGRTVAVDPRAIPLGTHLLINGQEYIAEDVGGAVKNKHIDIFFDQSRIAHQTLYYTEVYRIA